jgi:two-component system CheB/CheR fusion protein
MASQAPTARSLKHREPAPKSAQREFDIEAERATRNFLSTLRSVLQKSLQSSEDLAEFAAHFDGRLAALSQAHLLHFRRRAEGADLEELIRDQLRFPTVPDEEQVDISGPPVRLDAILAQNFALTVHELAVNALKYGALSVRNGRIRVRWKVSDGPKDSRLALTWKESGVPAMATEPEHFGFGRELIERALPYEIGALTSLDFAPGGIKCVIDVAYPRGNADR